jgi:hypothetical protein
MGCHWVGTYVTSDDGGERGIVGLVHSSLVQVNVLVHRGSVPAEVYSHHSVLQFLPPLLALVVVIQCAIESVRHRLLQYSTMTELISINVRFH